jgi:hypothetical protein
MSLRDKAAWATAGVLALVLHSSALVAFAGLLKERSVAPALAVTFQDRDWLKAEAVSEGTATSAVTETPEQGDAIADQPPEESLQQTEDQSEQVESASEGVVPQAADANTVSETPSNPAAAVPQESTAISESADSATQAPAAETLQPDQAISTSIAESDRADAAAPVSASESLTSSNAAAVNESGSVAVSEPIASSDTSSATDNASSPDSTALVETTDDKPIESQAPTAIASQEEALGEVSTDAPIPAAQEPDSSQLAMLKQKPTPQPSPPKPSQPPADVEGTIKSYGGGSCFMALPEQSAGGDSWSVTAYAEAGSAFDEFETFLSSKNITGIKQYQRSIQKAQCGAVSLAQLLKPEPDEKLIVKIETPVVADGAELSATITGMSRKWLYIMLVDDEGLAQDVTKFAKLESDTVKLSAPAYVKGKGRDRTQLLLVISSSAALAILDLKDPEPLADLLPLLKGEIAAGDTKAAVTLTHFQVR